MLRNVQTMFRKCSKQVQNMFNNCLNILKTCSTMFTKCQENLRKQNHAKQQQNSRTTPRNIQGHPGEILRLERVPLEAYGDLSIMT
jgi:hypothetical protein